MRRNTIILGIIVFVCVYTAVGQQPDKRIEMIRAEVATMEQNLPTYERTSKTRLAGISRDAEADYFSSKNELKKINARILGDTGRSDNEYYYRDDKLIFAKQRWTKYDGSIRKGPVKTVKVVESIAYFDSGECISLLLDNKIIRPDSEEWKKELFSVESTSSIFRARK